MSALFLRLVSSKKLGLRRVVAYLRRVAESAELPGVPRPVEYAVTLGNSDGDVVRPVVVANSCDAQQQQDGGYYGTFCNCALRRFREL